MKNMFFRPTRGKGFTLIELLVVVAIMAVLMSVLLPSLATARNSAKMAVCGSNLRQIGMALSVYYNENTDKFNPDLNGPYINWFGLGGYKTGTQSTAIPIEQRILYGYLSQEKSFICPMDNERSAVGGVKQSVHYTWGISYSLNLAGVSPKHSTAAKRLSAAASPGTTIFAGDTTMQSVGTGWPCDLGNYSWHSRDSRLSNVLFFDMHVAPVKVTLAPGSTRVGGDYKWIATNP